MSTVLQQYNKGGFHCTAFVGAGLEELIQGLHKCLNKTATGYSLHLAFSGGKHQTDINHSTRLMCLRMGRRRYLLAVWSGNFSESQIPSE